MASRRTNLALMVLLAITLATGSLAFGVGTGWNRLVVVAHGVAAAAIVVLSPAKQVIVRRGVARARPGRASFLGFTVLILVALLSGVAHSTGLARSFGPVTAMQVHVGAALLALPLAVWHVWVRRVRVRRADFGRRQLLRAGVVLAVAGGVYAGVEILLRALQLPGRKRRFTGSFEQGSFSPEAMPVTQWLNDPVPQLDAPAWSLSVRTARGTTRIGYDELAGSRDRVRATLDCTGGWYAEQDWEGIRLSRLLGEIPEGASVIVVSATGYSRRLPGSDAAHLLLATRAGGRPLSAGHGYPARLVAPGRRGFWWVKWVTAVEVDLRPWWWQPPFPVT